MNKKFKKASAILLCVVIGLTIMGCSNKKSEKSDGGYSLDYGFDDIAERKTTLIAIDDYDESNLTVTVGGHTLYMNVGTTVYSRAYDTLTFEGNCIYKTSHYYCTTTRYSDAEESELTRGSSSYTTESNEQINFDDTGLIIDDRIKLKNGAIILEMHFIGESSQYYAIYDDIETPAQEIQWDETQNFVFSFK